MMGLPDGPKSFQIGLVVLIQYRLWQTPSQPPSHVAVAITLNAKASSLKISDFSVAWGFCGLILTLKRTEILTLILFHFKLKSQLSHHHESSLDHMYSERALWQPNVTRTMSLGPLSPDAEGFAINSLYHCHLHHDLLVPTRLPFAGSGNVSLDFRCWTFFDCFSFMNILFGFVMQ